MCPSADVASLLHVHVLYPPDRVGSPSLHAGKLHFRRIFSPKRTKRRRCGDICRDGDARRGVRVARRSLALLIFQKISKIRSKYVEFCVLLYFFVSKSAFVSFLRRPSPSDTGNLLLSASPARELPKSGYKRL